jgi:hypothetical protein
MQEIYIKRCRPFGFVFFGCWLIINRTTEYTSSARLSVQSSELSPHTPCLNPYESVAPPPPFGSKEGDTLRFWRREWGTKFPDEGTDILKFYVYYNPSTNRSLLRKTKTT